jgi:transcriptional regulator with PAS, ATPase and Fis domain
MRSRKALPASKGNPAILDKSLGESFQIFTPFFQTSKVGFGICDKQLRYLAVNRALAASNHLPVEAHLGRTIRDVLGDVASSVEPAFDRALTTQQPVLREISGKPAARAEIVHWIATYFPVKDAAGKVRHLVGIVLEVTDQKRLEESIRSLTLQLVQTETKQQSRVLKQLHPSTFNITLLWKIICRRWSGLFCGSQIVRNRWHARPNSWSDSRLCHSQVPILRNKSGANSTKIPG